jgi:hypothetical protein
MYPLCFSRMSISITSCLDWKEIYINPSFPQGNHHILSQHFFIHTDYLYPFLYKINIPCTFAIMPTFKTITAISLLAVFSTLATAMPAPQASTSELLATPVPGGVLTDVATVNVYSGNSCDGTSTSFNVVGSGVSSCTPVSNAHSILVSGR